MSTVKVEFNQNLCIATINRPEARNAINFAVMDELEVLLNELESRKEVRVFVLKGAGEKAFISGGDLREFHTIKTAPKARQMAERMLSLLERIEMLPCWTMACVDGAAYGGGCEIILAFDFRIGSERSVYGFTQGKFYLPPGWGGLTRLVERVGRSTALRWLAETAVIDAQTAYNHTLIDRIVPDDQIHNKTKKWAEDLSGNGRNYIETLKKGTLAFAENRWKAISKELEAFGTFWEDERHRKRVEKFLNKRRD